MTVTGVGEDYVNGTETLLQLLVLVAVTLTVTSAGVNWGIIPCIVLLCARLCGGEHWRALEQCCRTMPSGRIA